MNNKSAAIDFVSNRNRIISENIETLSAGNTAASERLLALQSEIECLRAELISPERSMESILAMIEDRLELIHNLTKKADELSKQLQDSMQNLQI